MTDIAGRGGWHASAELLTAYVTGEARAVEAASVEQHLLRCAPCRSALADHGDRRALDRGWLAISDEIEATPLPAVVRAARRLGLPEPTSVLLAATASLRTAWVTSAVLALGFAFLVSCLAGGTTLWPYLLIAPLVPVIGVAAAYGPAEDSLETLVVVSPYGRTRLVLVRTVAVLVTCLPFAAVLGLMLPGPGWVAVGWLGPALTLVPVLLALGSFIGPRPASWVVALGWAAVVVGSARHLAPTWPIEEQRQLVLLAMALVAASVLAARARAGRVPGDAL